MDQEEEVTCSICRHPQPALAVLQLPCSHHFHIPCLRSNYRHLLLNCKEPSPSLRCPNCRRPVPDSVFTHLEKELRLLRIRYPLSKHWLQKGQDAEYCAIIKPDSESQVRSDTQTLAQLCPDPQHPDQKIFETDFEISVQDPKAKFTVWIECTNARDWTIISDSIQVGTTALDHDSSDDEYEEEEEVMDVITPEPSYQAPFGQPVSDRSLPFYLRMPDTTSSSSERILPDTQSGILFKNIQDCLRRHEDCKNELSEWKVQLRMIQDIVNRCTENERFRFEMMICKKHVRVAEDKVQMSRSRLQEARQQLRDFFV